jgi:hypothetical protein
LDWNEWFYYRDGQLYWKKVNVRSPAKVDSVAGFYDSNGYRQVQLNDKKYRVHRIIYELLKGPIPESLFIDHVNGRKDDNRIENLRLATHAENLRNRGATKNSKTGVKGVSWRKDTQKYQAKIKVNGVKKHLGYYNTLEEAAAAYNTAAKKLHGEFACITS